jgi:hypothetical protein
MFLVEPDAKRRDLNISFKSLQQLSLSEQQCTQRIICEFFVTGDAVNLFTATDLVLLLMFSPRCSNTRRVQVLPKPGSASIKQNFKNFVMLQAMNLSVAFTYCSLFLVTFFEVLQ